MIPFFLDHLLGFIRPIDPREWPLLIRRLRAADGWMPPMLLIATMMTLSFVGQGIGLLGGNVAIKVYNYVASATWLVVGVISALAVTLDGVNNLRRLGLSGVTRPRWWFELSRLMWMLLLYFALTIWLILVVGEPRFIPVGDLLFHATRIFAIAFFVASTLGYSISWITKRRRRGRAFECVQYFYCVFGGCGAVTFLAIWIPVRARWATPLTAVACLIAASLIGALILTISHRYDRREERSREIAL